MLKGYKTYITAVVAVIAAVAAYLVGDVNLADTIQIVVTALMSAFLRNGMKGETANASVSNDTMNAQSKKIE